MAYVQPRRYSANRPYDDNPVYDSQTPRMHIPQEQATSYPPPPPQHQPSYQRPRNSSNVSQRSQNGPYLPQPHQQQDQLAEQQLTPYGQSAPPPLAPQQQQQQLSGHYPPAPPGVQAGSQLHPSEAYAQDPYAARQRRESATSHRSTQSHRSHHSSASRRSEEHRTGRKDGQRATLGDSLFGIWDTLRNVIPVSRR